MKRRNNDLKCAEYGAYGSVLLVRRSYRIDRGTYRVRARELVRYWLGKTTRHGSRFQEKLVTRVAGILNGTGLKYGRLRQGRADKEVGRLSSRC